MTPGATIHITGARSAAGTVKAATEITLTIQETRGCFFVLRRDPASTTPWQWRWAGLPVTIHSAPDLADFRTRLADLDRRTR